MTAMPTFQSDCLSRRGYMQTSAKRTFFVVTSVSLLSPERGGHVGLCVCWGFGNL